MAWVGAIYYRKYKSIMHLSVAVDIMLGKS